MTKDTVWVVTKNVKYEGSSVESVHNSKQSATSRIDQLVVSHRYTGKWDTRDHGSPYIRENQDVQFIADQFPVENND
jgi:hypothetical protein